MARRKIKKAKLSNNRNIYPTLKQHLMGRRRFLELAGGCLGSIAAGGVLAACGRELGVNDGDAGTADATVDPDRQVGQDVEIGGVVQEPDYYTVRLPASGELTAYLTLGGRCLFYVNVATYSASAHDFFVDEREAANDLCRTTMADFTYEDLDRAGGVGEAEDDLMEALLTWLEDNLSQAEATLEAVSLFIVELDPDPGLDGGMPQPSYP
jgi:hypothetical protein